jgi:nitrate reductase assembly molybdenum cofactor insertion protein NarJ
MEQPEGYSNMIEYKYFSKLFSYPTERLSTVIDNFEGLVYSEHMELLDKFIDIKFHFENQSISELQEYYIRTFDVNASCYLDIGYVLFGEDSKRAQFLLNMQSEQSKINNDCGREFADHLPNVLTLLDGIVGTDFREELIVVMLIPALGHMLDNFRTDDNVYKSLLECLLFFLKAEYPNSEYEPYRIQSETEKSNVYTCGIEFIKEKIN